MATGPNDTLFYEIAASNLANGRGYTELFGAPTAGWPPGFPFLMSLGYRVVGDHHKLVFASTSRWPRRRSCCCTSSALRMFGRRGARLAGWTFAILPGPIFFTGLYLSETLFIFLLVGFLALAMLAARAAAGPRSSWAWRSAWRRSRAARGCSCSSSRWRCGGACRGATWLRRGALLVGAMALTIAPWTIRNAIRMDAFIPVSRTRA